MIKKNIAILTILLVGCGIEEEIKKIEEPANCITMNISKSWPVQMWLNNIASFNNKKESGIIKKCFYQKWNCEDKLKWLGFEEEASVQELPPPNEWGTPFGPGFVLPEGEKTSTTFYHTRMFAGGNNRAAYVPLPLANGEEFFFDIYVSYSGSIDVGTTTPSFAFTLMDDSNATDPDAIHCVWFPINDPGIEPDIYGNGHHRVKIVGGNASTRLVLTSSLNGVSSLVITIQPSVKEFSLRVNDSLNNEITTLPMVRIPAEITEEITSAEWIAAATTNANGGTFNWSGPNVNLSFGGAGTAKSYLKYVPVVIGGGQRVRMFLESGHSKTGSNITASSISMGLYDAAFNLLAEHKFNTGTGSYGITRWFEIENTSDTPAVYVGIYTEATASGSGASSSFIDYGRAAYNLYPETANYEITFIPNANDVCNQKVWFELLEDGESFAYSDLQDIRTLHKDTNMVNYTNDEEYDEIQYDVSAIVFGIRLHSKFYEPESPEENESEPDSDGHINKLMSEVKDRTLFEIEPVPPYMLRKLKRVFNHNSIWVANMSYTKEEVLEKDKLDDKFALFPLKTWLTQESDNFVTNVY